MLLKLSSVSVPRKDVREISETSPKPDALLKQGKNNFYWENVCICLFYASCTNFVMDWFMS